MLGGITPLLTTDVVSEPRQAQPHTSACQVHLYPMPTRPAPPHMLITGGKDTPYLAYVSCMRRRGTIHQVARQACGAIDPFQEAGTGGEGHHLGGGKEAREDPVRH